MQAEVENRREAPEELRALCEEFRQNNRIPIEKFDMYGVKRGF